MGSHGLNAEHMGTLGMLLSTGSLPRLLRLFLDDNGFGDEGMQALLESLGRGAAPLLRTLYLNHNQFGPQGAEALAAALGRGSMRKLHTLSFGSNPICNQGVSTLAVPLRKTAIKTLYLSLCHIGDEGMASLFADLNKEDFKMLEYISMGQNLSTDKGCAMIVSAIDSDRMPSFRMRLDDHGSEAIRDAIVRRQLRKAPPAVGFGDAEWDATRKREVAAQRRRVLNRTSVQCILCLQERTPLLPLPGGRCTHPVMCEGCSSVQTRKCNEDPEFAEQLQAMCPECCVAPA